MPRYSTVTGLPQDRSFLLDTHSVYLVDSLTVQRVLSPRFRLTFTGSLAAGYRADVGSMRFAERVELSSMLLGRLRDQARCALIRSLLLSSGSPSFQVALADLVHSSGFTPRELAFRTGLSVKRIKQFLDPSYRLTVPHPPSRSYLEDLNVLWSWLRASISSQSRFASPIVTAL